MRVRVLFGERTLIKGQTLKGFKANGDAARYFQTTKSNAARFFSVPSKRRPFVCRSIDPAGRVFLSLLPAPDVDGLNCGAVSLLARAPQLFFIFCFVLFCFASSTSTRLVLGVFLARSFRNGFLKWPRHENSGSRYH